MGKKSRADKSAFYLCTKPDVDPKLSRRTASEDRMRQMSFTHINFQSRSDDKAKQLGQDMFGKRNIQAGPIEHTDRIKYIECL